ncbi:MAG: hypothetical protein JW973_14505 [Bacteroidales bacterium]|nr:hypothetical protein [Bacteroidales bacterium]
MKRPLLLIIYLFFYVFNYGQTIYKTYYGDYLYPVDTFRVLNFFINIIYDQCDEECNPYPDPALTPNWVPGPPNTININPPSYLSGFMDSDLGSGFQGTYTKRYAEASFNKFIVIGDHVVVNITQSRITPNNPNAHFGYTDVLDAAVKLINENGGLNTINNHNNLSDYDCIDASRTKRFFNKPQNISNKIIDFIQIYFRNSTDTTGGVSGGGGSFVQMRKYLKFLNGDSCKNELGTVQGALGNDDLFQPEYPTADIHEMGHNLFGQNNSIHMGGGGPLTYGSLTTLEANSGWSFMGGSGSSLISTCGFDRWRLNWISLSNNGIPIAVNGVSSDIVKSPGTKTFYLRDFITYGDAVRIKLPYVDAGALNQYIWLENHRIHTNGKVDYPLFWAKSCKDDGVPGIYAYYQVGKDIREGSYSNMLPKFTDHLVQICADGNWDIILKSNSTSACVAGGSVKIQEYTQENPFSGYNDLENHYFNSISGNTINWKYDRQEFVIKLLNGVQTNKLANNGDNNDPFTGTKSMSISTNPAPFNVVTYHITKNTEGVISKTSDIDNRKIHLSGLRIDMTSQQNGTMKVDVRWDYYNVTKNVRWTGDIVLHENVILNTGKTITFDQNNTPNQHIRNTVTGVFAGPTYFNCLNNSNFTMQSSSYINQQNLSSFILNSGSKLTINDGAIFTVKSGCTMQVKSGSTLDVYGSGRIEVENGGYICIENGSNVKLNNVLSFINLRPGYTLGVNTSVIPNPGTCVNNANNINYTGYGAINTTFTADTYIQNVTLTGSHNYTGRNIYAGQAVDPNPSHPQGPVLIKSGANVVLDYSAFTIIDKGFTAELGATFTAL